MHGARTALEQQQRLNPKRLFHSGILLHIRGHRATHSVRTALKQQQRLPPTHHFSTSPQSVIPLVNPPNSTCMVVRH